MRQIQFGEYRIEIEDFTLYRKGKAVQLGRKPLDTLLFLIENRDRVVTKESLRRNIWHSERIAASTIPMCIKEIRNALQDSASQPKFIQATRGRGYRFISEIKVTSSGSSPITLDDEFQFIGRESELQTIKRSLRQTSASLRGHLLCITGEAGAGKTRLVSEAIQRFSYQANVVFTKASPTNSGFTYSVWLQALDQLAQSNEQAQELLRDLRKIENSREMRIGRPDDITGLTDSNQSIFYQRWISVFRSISALRPTLLVVEDIHYADRDSLQLLDHLSTASRTMPLTIIATFRPSLTGRIDSQPVVKNWSAADSDFIHIPPLTVDEISRLIGPIAHKRHELASEIFRLTSGNAFYTTHLLRVWGTAHTPILPNDAKGVSTENAHDIIARQLSDLPRSTYETLAAASTIGIRFPLRLLADVLDISEGETLERIEPARIAKAVRQVDIDFEFRHSILRDCLYHAMHPSIRTSMHKRVSDSLGQLDPKASPIELFEHQRLGHPLVPIECICQTALEAALRLMSTFSYHEATRVLHAASELAQSSLCETSDLRFDVMIALAGSLLYSGDTERIRLVLEEAKRLAREANSAVSLARCGLAMAPDFLSIEVGTYDIETVMILSESLAGIPSTEKGIRARVLARLSQFAQWGGKGNNTAERLATEAVSEARASRDSGAIRSALESYADSIHGPDRTDDRICVIQELREKFCLNGENDYSYLLQQTRLIAALLEKGEIRQVAIENESYRQRAERTGLPQYRWYPVSTDSMLACLAGDLDCAGQLAEQYSKIAGPNPDENFRQTFACQYALREIENDASYQIVGLIEEFSRKQPAVLSWSAAHAWALWDCGREQAARECLRQFSESDIIRLYREPGGTIGIAAIAEVTAYHGDRARARRLLELLLPVANRCATAGLGVAYFGSLSRYAGLLALSVRDFEVAAKLIRDAVRDETHRGAQSWEWYSRLDYVRAIQRKLEINPREKIPNLQRFIGEVNKLVPRAQRRIKESLDLPNESGTR